MAVSDATSGGGVRAAPALGGLIWKLTKRWLYIIHRWIGIFTCILCAVWFFSGLVMMYVPYPGLSDHDRMVYSQPLDFSRVQVAPDKAMAGLDHFPTIKLAMLRGEPVWRVQDGQKRLAISAVDGRKVGLTGAAWALEVVQGVRPDATGATVATLFHDQWTVAQGFNPHRPLHKVTLNDGAGTVLYVSSKTGEIVNDTVRTERFWNWVGSIPHWIYFTVIRQDGQFWRQVILWTSGPALIGALIGVWVGILRLRLKRRYRHNRVTPYHGWMEWHHISGLIAGVVLCTWIFSGWLSVNPFGWFDRAGADRGALQRYAGHATADFPADTAMLRGLGRTEAREARLIWIGGRPLVVLMGTDLKETALDARTGQPANLTDRDLFALAGRTLAKAPVALAERLTHEDAYWYSHHTQRRLPVLRVKFADARQTWFHIDPATGEVLGRTDSSGRTYRWLFNFLHDFDVRPLLANRPAWDVYMWTLSTAGLIISVSGVVIGWRRLKKKFGPGRTEARRGA
jgi:hypothetical protein